MSDPLDDNDNAPDEALLGPGSTATGGGTSQDATADASSAEADGDAHIQPLDPDNGPAQLADERFRHPDL
ncbi:MAG: hypothetical protein ABWX76_01995 [Leifsonia flava]